MKERILNAFPNVITKEFFVAGGAITSLHTNSPINDYDIYPKSEEAREALIEYFFDYLYLFCSFVSSRAITFSDKEGGKYQIMTFDTFETPQKIFDMFDFTISMGAFDFETEKFILHDQFLVHNSQRFLKFNHNTKYPYASAARVDKFKKRGYTIGKAEFFKILLACQRCPINSWVDLKEQFGGIYGEVLEIPEGVEFSFMSALDAISNLKPLKAFKGFRETEHAIIATTSKTVFSFDNGEEILYRIDGSDTWHNFPKNSVSDYIIPKPKNVKAVTLEEMVQSIEYYVVLDYHGNPSTYPTTPNEPKFRVTSIKPTFIKYKRVKVNANDIYMEHQLIDFPRSLMVKRIEIVEE